MNVLVRFSATQQRRKANDRTVFDDAMRVDWVFGMGYRGRAFTCTDVRSYRVHRGKRDVRAYERAQHDKVSYHHLMHQSEATCFS